MAEAPRGKLTGAGLGLFVVATVAMMIVPLPTQLLDVLLTLNLGISVALLLTAVYAGATLELSTFPTILVLTTLLRLALNVSSVRLILLQANAGRVIHAFGNFVVRGDYVVGGIVFLILTIVQYVVISRGAERVAEVAARFTLDAMPGKQLAIDADLRASLIDGNEARARRATLAKEAGLYGALDGAMRFVKGDAVAGILILALSLAGGLIIGVARNNLPLADAARIYTLLTIGDGLVTQIPALLISSAAGLVVTRVASDESSAALGSELVRQLFRPRVLGITAALLAILAAVPGLPLWPFALVAALAAILASRQSSKATSDARTSALHAPILELILDPQLAEGVPDLTARCRDAVARWSERYGLPLPPLEIRSSGELPLRTYQLKLRGVPVAEGRVPDGRLLALAPLDRVGALGGGPDAEAALDAQGRPAAWIPASTGAKLRQAGLTILDPAGAVTAQLEIALGRTSGELIGIEETQRLIDAVNREAPALVREVIPRRIEVRALAEVLRRLAGEGIPLVSLREVLEALAREPAIQGEDPTAITEQVRGALKRMITHQHTQNRRLDALVLDSNAEEAVRGALRPTQSGIQVALEPDLHDLLLKNIRRGLEGHEKAVLVTSSELRRHVRRIVEDELPELPVIAYGELLPDVQVEPVATIGMND